MNSQREEVCISIWTRLLDLVSPRLCPVCGRRLTPSEAGLCAECLMHLPRTYFEQDAYQNEMARRFWGLMPLEKAVALFYYEAQAETSALIYNLKYHDQPELGRQLGAFYARQLLPTHFFDDIDVIVPLPLARRRQRQRGYNQSLEIAKGVADATGLPIYNKVVRRTKFVKSQTKVNFWERKENVEDVFELADTTGIAGRHLLLIDDIVTTGATSLACGKVLTAVGGVHLSILSLGFTKS